MSEYKAPRRDRVVSSLTRFIFRFATEDYRNFAQAVNKFGRAELDRHAQTLLRSIERREELLSSVDSLPDG